MTYYVDPCYRVQGYALFDPPCGTAYGYADACYWVQGYAVDDPLCASSGSGSGGSISATTLMSGLVFDRTVQDAPLTMTREPVHAVHMRRDTGAMYFVDTLTGEIMRWDGDDINRTPYEWRSKTFIVPKPMNFSFAQVIHDDEASSLLQQALAAVAANQAIWAASGTGGCNAKHGCNAALGDVEANQYEVNGSAMQNVPTVDAIYTTLRVYADDVLVFSVNAESEKLYRLPAGFRATRWEVEIMGNKGVRRITLATSSKEIAEQ